MKEAISVLKEKRAQKSEYTENDFKPHMMYDPESGEGVMVQSYKQHLKLQSMGWGH